MKMKKKKVTNKKYIKRVTFVTFLEDNQQE